MAASASNGGSASRAERPVVLCGPSGVGKSTLIKRLFVDHPEFGFSVSRASPAPPSCPLSRLTARLADTTRKPRPGETDGVSYHFVSRDDFHAAVQRGEFLEHAEFGGNCYGTTAKAVQDVQQGQTGKNRALLDIDTQVSLPAGQRQAGQSTRHGREQRRRAAGRALLLPSRVAKASRAPRQLC
jgi:guanylate kinase